MRMKFFRIRPETCAKTSWLFSSFTLNIAFGRVSMTTAMTSIASSFDNPYPDSARLPQAAFMQLPRQHHSAFGSHRYRMLEVRAQAAVFRDCRPAVAQDLNACFPGVHHRLDRQHHALAQLGSLPATAIVRN